MITVKTYDKRFIRGYQIHWFDTEKVNGEVITFVKEHAKAYDVSAKGEQYITRESFLYKYGVDKDKQVESYRKRIIKELSNREEGRELKIRVSDADVIDALQNNYTPKQAAYALKCRVCGSMEQIK